MSSGPWNPHLIKQWGPGAKGFPEDLEDAQRMATSLGVSAGLTLMILVTVPYLETGLFLEQMLLDSESD